MLPVHYAGIPADMDRLMALAESKGLLLVEDAAHAPAPAFTAGCVEASDLPAASVSLATRT